MSVGFGLKAWLIANRSSARLALLLRAAIAIANSVLSLLWTPLLLGAMGQSAFGTLSSFQRALGLLGLGDFGLSGGVALRVGQFIGRGDENGLQRYLASARTLLLMVAFGLGGVICVLSPWLPNWLGFTPDPGSGPLSLLFIVGALCLTAGFALTYFGGLNAAYATLTWPILPTFVLGQLSILMHWRIASAGAVLWVQMLSQLLATVLQAVVLWWLVRAAHPQLSNVLPLRRDPEVWRDLAGASGWIYLYSIGYVIFSSTDALLVNAGFGAVVVTQYLLNFKPIEVALKLVGAATSVGLSKINIWIHSPDPAMQERAKVSTIRLNMFQSWFGTAAAAVYLALNDWFISFWVGPHFHVPAAWQIAFALTLAITMGGDAGVQVAALTHKTGLRIAGMTIAGTAFLNLTLSFIAMRAGSIVGIALATVVAQSVLAVILARFTSSKLQMSWMPWFLRAWIMPAGSIGLLGIARLQFTSLSPLSIAMLLLLSALVLIVHAWAIGLRWSIVKEELAIAQQMFGVRR